jgi:hypothetical protein
MTTIQIDLPAQLAQAADRAGLLSPESLEGMLWARLRERRLITAMKRMDRESRTPSMSHEELEVEVAALRASRLDSPHSEKPTSVQA